METTTHTPDSLYPEGTTYRIEERANDSRNDIVITTPDYKLRVPQTVLTHNPEEYLRDLAHELFMQALEVPIGGSGPRTVRARGEGGTVALRFSGERGSLDEERDLIYTLMDAANEVHWHIVGHELSTPPAPEDGDR